MNYFIGIVVIALVVTYVVLRKRKSGNNVRPDEKQSTASNPESSFHAVSLKFSVNACQAARDMDGRRFLSGVAPRIPLPGCDANECRCKFVHHSDRRSRESRRSPFMEGGVTAQLRREQRDSSERREGTSDDIF